MRYTAFSLLLCLIAFPAYAQTEGFDEEKLKEHVDGGMKLMNEKDFTNAIYEFEQALELNPNLPQVYNLLGVAYLHQGVSIESAIGSFQEAIRMDPQYDEPYFNLAVTYVGPGEDPERAAQYFEKTIQINPQFFKAYLGLGWLTLFERKQPEAAITLFQKTIELFPDQAEAQYGLGMAYVVTGKKALALKPLSVLRSMNRLDFASSLEQVMNENSEAQPTQSSPQAATGNPLGSS